MLHMFQPVKATTVIGNDVFRCQWKHVIENTLSLEKNKLVDWKEKKENTNQFLKKYSRTLYKDASDSNLFFKAISVGIIIARLK